MVSELDYSLFNSIVINDDSEFLPSGNVTAGRLLQVLGYFDI